MEGRNGAEDESQGGDDHEADRYHSNHLQEAVIWKTTARQTCHTGDGRS